MRELTVEAMRQKKDDLAYISFEKSGTNKKDGTCDDYLAHFSKSTSFMESQEIAVFAGAAKIKLNIYIDFSPPMIIDPRADSAEGPLPEIDLVNILDVHFVPVL